MRKSHNGRQGHNASAACPAPPDPAEPHPARLDPVPARARLGPRSAAAPSAARRATLPAIFISAPQNHRGSAGSAAQPLRGEPSGRGGEGARRHGAARRFGETIKGRSENGLGPLHSKRFVPGGRIRIRIRIWIRAPRRQRALAWPGPSLASAACCVGSGPHSPRGGAGEAVSTQCSSPGRSQARRDAAPGRRAGRPGIRKMLQ